MEVETKGLRVDLSRAVWQKSTRSGPNTDMCVEVAFVDDAVAVRDSMDPASVLIFFPDGWDELGRTVRTVYRPPETAKDLIWRMWSTLEWRKAGAVSLVLFAAGCMALLATGGVAGVLYLLLGTSPVLSAGGGIIAGGGVAAGAYAVRQRRRRQGPVRP